MLTSAWGRALSALGALVVIALTWFILQFFPLGASGRETIVIVHQGESMASITDELHQAGILASTWAFRAATLLQGTPQVTPGAYEIRQGASFFSIHSILSSLPNAPQVDVTPGLTLREIAADLTNQEGAAYAATFMADATAAAATNAYHPNGVLEGLVGPGLYVITPTETPAKLLGAMQSAFSSEAQNAGLNSSSTVSGLDAYQLVIAASIVEKEGYYPVNMPKVARVIYNRLARNMPLQMDSTVLYALNLDGGQVTTQMLRTHTPYNTYLNVGLTPTPICVVSPQALAAVLHPPAGTWLYFVLVNNNGTMAFSTTYAQQLANEAIAAKAGL
jgi:UPF0755 protein